MNTTPTPRSDAHTPTPWRVFTPEPWRIRIGRSATQESAEYVATLFDGPRKESNAAFIVRACNSHDALVGALEAVVEWAGQVPSSYREWKFVEQARAALASARGGAK